MSAASASPRLEIRSGPPPKEAGSFAEDVRAGLSAARKYLSSKYFYDELGSALFDAITVLPEYYLTRAETQILRECGWEMVRALGNPVEFIELGSGSAIKTRILIEEALRVQRTLHYSPIDISGEALTASAQALVAAFPGLTVTAYAGDYFGVLGTPQLQREGRVLAMFMGSNIGNYEPADGARLLRGIAETLKPGDGLLLGTDMRKDSRTLELAYDDPTGVTAAFNKNLLARINRDLEADFDLDDFVHIARYDESRGAVCSYLEALRPVAVRIQALEMNVSLHKGERIHTESSYKYSAEQIDAMAHAAGLRLQTAWTDEPHHRFRVNLLVK
ncbi:MAG TPA: L-histidine N(alpha)-methyltransferase [Candidatus Baltobacteraceae bacterium]|nr:L-histidine N(alpha)-methyltransferase [Candidatus Baltobacteraceae bacterium]